MTFPQLEIGADGEQIRRYARTVEELGFEHLVAYDHVLGADHDRDDDRIAAWPAAAYDHADAFHEPFVLFAHLAAITERLEFATGVLILPQRQTALVAKQAAELSLLSGGRLRLGVAVGWNHLEFEALGAEFANRGRRLDEQVELLQRLWSEQVVDFEGRFHRLDRVGINPRPPGPIPIWMGAKSVRAFERLARCADGYIAPAGVAAPDLPLWLERLRDAIAAAGRDPDTVGIEGRVDLRYRDDAEALAEVERWRELGASRVTFNTMASEADRARPNPAAWHLERLAAFRAAAPELFAQAPQAT